MKRSLIRFLFTLKHTIIALFGNEEEEKEQCLKGFYLKEDYSFNLLFVVVVCCLALAELPRPLYSMVIWLTAFAELNFKIGITLLLEKLRRQSSKRYTSRHQKA